MIRMNECGNRLVAGQQADLMNARALSLVHGELARSAAELTVDMVAYRLWLVTQGHAKSAYRMSRNPPAAGGTKTG